MRVLSKKQKKYGDGGRMYANGGTLPKPYGYGQFRDDPPSASEMFNALSPSLQDFARRKGNREMYYGINPGSFYHDTMKRNQQFDGLMDRDGNVLPMMKGAEMRAILEGQEGLRSDGEAQMAMMLNRMLQRAMAGDTYAEDFLNRVNDAYDGRIAEERSEAERMARLSKGSGKPGPYER